jgi:predicted CoA-substrate-specific enzyme activase
MILSMRGEDRALGICLGASTLGAVEIERRNGAPIVVRASAEPHDGDPRGAFARLVAALDPAAYSSVAVTGRRFRELVDLPSVPEPEAVEAALAFVRRRESNGRYDAVLSAGGETFLSYVLDGEDRIVSVRTGNRCASGTGEFFLQQIRRMDLGVDDAVRLARGSRPHRISARCSVFCKSDCTHALNRGESRGAVAAGLAEMMAGRLSGLVDDPGRARVLLVGGAARNGAVVEHLRREVPGVVVPEEAPWFEALGAALWALDHPRPGLLGDRELVRAGASAFRFHPPLAEAAGLVTFAGGGIERARAGDRCVVGLDVGSTTTKAVVLRLDDGAVVARTYRRTEGDPVGASRACYADLERDLAAPVEITGLGVTGSGRYIAGLHALTDGIVNEILAHATAAARFDPGVDTIFEIGGQDAKYTFLTEGVPSDYAMNEACSAGTGSFLEEAARESLGIPVAEIEGLALRARRPPNFNDQCSAFIASDLKTAAQDGIPREDIVAGLVYSVCLNYVNRVRGTRPVGSRIFMQGGVCYNRAVPVAMAALVGRPITVPPDPGLAGALGAALEIARRLREGESEEKRFDLGVLARREVGEGKPFVCAGGPSRCDRKCEIRLVEIEGRRYPFGGACNRYYDLRLGGDRATDAPDLVDARRHTLLDPGPGAPALPAGAPTVGLQRSFLVHTLLPLYRRFFEGIGRRVVLPEESLEEGRARKGAPFCHPAEIAHGTFAALLREEPDAIFLPHVRGLEVPDDGPSKKLCPIVQAEPWVLRSAFGLRGGGGPPILSPVIDFTGGLEAAREEFVEVGRALGAGARRSRAAFDDALEEQRAREAGLRRLGAETLARIADDPDGLGVVLFGRPYNAFASETNMGIPAKFATRGVPVIPWDLLPAAGPVPPTMYWASGRGILRAAGAVARHPRLFGVYVTSFSCGPDSFLLTFFRDAMGRKPSLTLELDSHTADAGITTRVEAALDVFRRYRDLERRGRIAPGKRTFVPARLEVRGEESVVATADGERLDLRHPRVRVLFPSMGDLSTEAIAALFRGLGVRAEALPPADEDALRLGLTRTTGKECLPLALTCGSFLRRLREGRSPGEVFCLFMPASDGPCRLGQYRVFLGGLLEKEEIADTAVLSLSDTDSYAGLGPEFRRRSFEALVAADVLEEARNALAALAVDPAEGIREFGEAWREIPAAMEAGGNGTLAAALGRMAERLGRIPLRGTVEEAKTIAVVGEIFVRRDRLSKRDLLERCARRGFVVRVAPLTEYLLYSDHVLRCGLDGPKPGLLGQAALAVRRRWQRGYEAGVRGALAGTGLCRAAPQDIGGVMEAGAAFVDPRLAGEAVVTVGSAMEEMLHGACGVISIGPFGCMPSRVAEAILSREMTIEGAARSVPELAEALREKGARDMPFLAIETDGKVFPQIVEARLEAFLLRAERFHGRG